MLKHTICLGLHDKETKTQLISTPEAYKILARLITANGYNGCTISESTGFYTYEDGTFDVEPSLRIEILFATVDKTLALIKDLKKAFNQESVSLETINVNNQFI